MDARTVIIRPVVSEKSYALIGEGKYTVRVDDRAHKTQIAHAIEEIFDVKVAEVRTSKVRSKPKRRGLHQGRSRAWKKAIVQLAPGDRIELFEGAENLPTRLGLGAMQRISKLRRISLELRRIVGRNLVHYRCRYLPRSPVITSQRVNHGAEQLAVLASFLGNLVLVGVRRKAGRGVLCHD